VNGWELKRLIVVGEDLVLLRFPKDRSLWVGEGGDLLLELEEQVCLFRNESRVLAGGVMGNKYPLPKLTVGEVWG